MSVLTVIVLLRVLFFAFLMRKMNRRCRCWIPAPTERTTLEPMVSHIVLLKQRKKDRRVNLSDLLTYTLVLFAFFFFGLFFRE